MEIRSRVQIHRTQNDLIVDYLGWAGLALLWLITIVKYPSLPDTIVTHFNTAGMPNDFGSKSTLLVLPVICTLLSIGIFFLARFPHHFNYPVKITPVNIVRQYTIASGLMRWLRLSIVCVFLVITWVIIRSATDLSGPGIWLLPVILTLIFLPIGYFLYQAVKHK